MRKDSPAGRALMEQFREGAAKILTGDVRLSSKYTGYLYPRSLSAAVSMFVDILGEPTEIRLSLESEKSLQVGWGCPNLLVTNRDDFNTKNIKTIQFVAQVFEDEAKWRELLLSLDCQPIRDEEEADRKAAEEKKAAEDAEKLAAFNAAGVVVGTKIKTGWYEEDVKRISGSRVQIGKSMYTKIEVGTNLKEGKWQVLK